MFVYILGCFPSLSRAQIDAAAPDICLYTPNITRNRRCQAPITFYQKEEKKEKNALPPLFLLICLFLFFSFLRLSFYCMQHVKLCLSISPRIARMVRVFFEAHCCSCQLCLNCDLLCGLRPGTMRRVLYIYIYLSFYSSGTK